MAKLLYEDFIARVIIIAVCLHLKFNSNILNFVSFRSTTYKTVEMYAYECLNKNISQYINLHLEDHRNSANRKCQSYYTKRDPREVFARINLFRVISSGR